MVKTDESDSLAGDMPESAVSKPGQESAVIQPPGIGPAIHLNGSACPVQEDQPVQVCIDYNSHNTQIHVLAAFLAYCHLLFTLLFKVVCSTETTSAKHYIY